MDACCEGLGAEAEDIGAVGAGLELVEHLQEDTIESYECVLDAAGCGQGAVRVWSSRRAGENMWRGCIWDNYIRGGLGLRVRLSGLDDRSGACS